MAPLWIALALLAMHSLPPTTSVNIGLCYGSRSNKSNHVPVQTAVDALKKYDVQDVRLYDYDPEFLSASRNASYSVLVSVPNEELPFLASSKANATAWFNKNLKPFIDTVLFSYIAVGNEAFSTYYVDSIRPAMDNLQSLLTANGLTGVRVSTLVSKAVFQDWDTPPSNVTFRKSILKQITEVVAFLEKYSSPLLLNVFPHQFVDYQPNPQEYIYLALFTSNVTLSDGNLQYYNLLDYIVDGFRWAMKKVGSTTLDVVVAQTGWPRKNAPAVAGTYNKNFVQHVQSLKGTPMKPNTYLQGYIFEMYNNIEAEDTYDYYGVFNRDNTLINPIF
ncbi:lichenase-like [Malania oleifera]|uniref:lichenase-like n=1 Tax=Malania oleifera TaxID=397392 RepID=UPI0025ADDC2F|nr:lichenase-like [Malania oleifera]